MSSRRRDDNEVLFGLALPRLIALLIIVNILTGAVWGFASKNSQASFQTYTRPLIVSGYIMLKSGISGGLFVWFWMANRQRFDKCIIPLQLAAVFTAAAGLTLILASMVM